MSDLGNQALQALTEFADFLDQSHLTVDEYKRFTGVLRDWPNKLWEQGFQEELRDILAARELAKLPPLTVEDVERARQYFLGNPPKEQAVDLPLPAGKYRLLQGQFERLTLNPGDKKLLTQLATEAGSFVGRSLDHIRQFRGFAGRAFIALSGRKPETPDVVFAMGVLVALVDVAMSAEGFLQARIDRMVGEDSPFPETDWI